MGPGRGVDWKRDGKRGAPGDFRPHGDCAVVSFDYSLNEAQTQAQAALRPARIPTKQAIPDAGRLVWRDARSGIGHAEDGTAGVLPDLHIDPPAGRRVLDRVVDEVGGNLLQPRSVAGD